MLMMLSLACGTDSLGDAEVDALTQTVQSELDAGYEDWGQLAEAEGVIESASVHGSHVQIWLNGDALDTIEAAEGADLPAGAMIVKQGYNDADGTDLGDLTVMYKDADFGWFWYSEGADGEVKEAGDVAMCSNCHSGGQDMVLVTSW
jgi:hypothetical protein